jgi:UDP-N-acetyl-D-glucosamine dehydrogenase
MNANGMAIKGSRVQCGGLAYKPNVDDMRETPTLVVMGMLRAYGADVQYYDPHIPVIPQTREHPEWAGLKSADWTDESVSSFDLAVVPTKHTGVDHSRVVDLLGCVIGTRDALPGIRTCFKLRRATARQNATAWRSPE